MRHRPVVAVVLLLVALVVPARSHAAESGAQIVDAAWIAAMKANDIDAVMKCYAPDAVMWLPNAPSARGAKAIRAGFSLTLVPKAGGDPVVMTGRFTEAAERRGGKRVYIVDHASAEPAP